MKTTPCRPRVLCSLTALALGAGLATAHDEDWRKLVDKLFAVEGPIWHYGDRVNRADTFASSGVTLMSQIPLNNFSAGSSFGNDCWGYVSPSGREYAIMGLYNGYGFVEITDPANPVIVQVITGPSSDWHDVKVVGTYAYGVSEGGSGIQVMNLANIDSGTVTLVGNISTGGHSTTHNIVANQETGSLWVVGANIGNGGLVHVDLSNPASPVISGGWTGMYVHDAQVVTMHSGPYAGREIAFCASGLSGGFTNTGLRIVDVTNPASPVVLSTFYYGNAGYSHQCWLSPDQQYLYLNDELDEDYGLVSLTTTRVIDVSDLTSPTLASTYNTGLDSIDHNLYTKDQYIFQADYRSGLQVFDATDALHPTKIAYFDTFPGSDSAAFNGAWSCWPYFPSGTVIVSDIERGLFVLRVDALDPTRLVLSLASSQPEIVDPQGGESIAIHIDEFSLTTDPSSVEMVFDDGTGPVMVAGADQGGGTFSFDFPGGTCGNEGTYYFVAQDTLGEVFTLPSTAPASTFSTTIADSVAVAFTDDFQTNMGWAVSGAVSGQGAGQWERGVPAGDGSRGDAPNDYDGSGQCYLTGNGGPGSNTDVDGGATILTSPTMDASGDPESMLTYARWYDNTGSGQGSNPGVETMEIAISNNNGSTWVALETVGPNDGESSGGWVEASFRIADYVTPTAQMRVRFTVSDDVGAVIEAAVDAVEISSLVCEPVALCPCDLDGSGALNLDDVNMFAVAFAGGDLAADMDGNGTLNLDDVNTFAGCFVGGCP
ncbi:MAG: choice-of-anchor B family protein [Phycisphaerales bacterium]